MPGAQSSFFSGPMGAGTMGNKFFNPSSAWGGGLNPGSFMNSLMGAFGPGGAFGSAGPSGTSFSLGGTPSFPYSSMGDNQPMNPFNPATASNPQPGTTFGGSANPPGYGGLASQNQNLWGMPPGLAGNPFLNYSQNLFGNLGNFFSSMYGPQVGAPQGGAASNYWPTSLFGNITGY